MDDISNNGSSKYEASPSVLPNSRSENRITNVFLHLKIGFWLFGIFMGGFFKWILCLFSPVPIKCIRHQVALVTGGANGLGRAICFELAKKGCHVVIADADIIGAKQTSEELKNLNIKSEAYHIDVSNYEQIQQLRKDIERDIGPVDILVNNAGLLAMFKLHEKQPQDIQRIFNVNLLSHFWTTRVFLGGMNKRGRGHIVAISSVLGKIGTPNAACYCATKFGIRGMMDSLQEELRWESSPIQFTTVFPNLINTRKEFIDRLFEMAQEKTDILLQCYNTPEEVAVRTVDGICQNTRYVYMNTITKLTFCVLSLIPDKFLDVVKDAFKPSTNPLSKTK